MISGRGRRLQRVKQALDCVPLPADTVETAFGVFRECGELPDHQRLAMAVVQRTKYGAMPGSAAGEAMDRDAQLRFFLNAPRRLDDQVMHSLYDEAVWGCETARIAAREVLMRLADIGLDVTEPEFAKRGIAIALPAFGTVGLHLLGFPECLAVAPYEAQAQRLFERFAALRARVGAFGERWFGELVEAIDAFRLDGELPEDELMRAAVLADAELVCLIRHQRGVDVGEMMAALRMLDADDGERAYASRVQELVRAGALLIDG